MEYPVEFDNLWMRSNQEKNDRFLYINSCGFQNNFFTKHTTLRSKGRVDYLFLYLFKGFCKAETKEGMVDLKSGDLLIYRPGERHYYSFFGSGAYEAAFIHFTGSFAEYFVDFAKDKNIIHTDNHQQIGKLINRIINDYVSDTDNMMSVSWFIQLCEFLKSSEKNIIDNRIANVLRYMNKNYQENNSMDFYADMCGLSVDRFAHLFKNAVGVSPHKYLLDIRIRQAKYLLEFSEININEVSSMVGFDDALYFSRVFKKYTGFSPKKYKI